MAEEGRGISLYRFWRIRSCLPDVFNSGQTCYGCVELMRQNPVVIIVTDKVEARGIRIN